MARPVFWSKWPMWPIEPMSPMQVANGANVASGANEANAANVANAGNAANAVFGWVAAFCAPRRACPDDSSGAAPGPPRSNRAGSTPPRRSAPPGRLRPRDAVARNGALQPGHPRHQVRFGSLKDQVIVIGHQTIRLRLPAGLFLGASGEWPGCAGLRPGERTANGDRIRAD